MKPEQTVAATTDFADPSGGGWQVSRGFYASPVGAAGRVYLASQQGATLVLKHGPTLEVLATNELDDGFDASPAITGDEIYLRGRKSLYCIAKN